MNNTASIMDVLIENISTDQKILDEVEKKVQEAKEEKREVIDRLKDYRKDLSVLLKYADEKQRAKLDELGFRFSELEHGLNPVASVALEILMKAEGNQITNGDLYQAYVATFKNSEDAFSYADFNIKCRPLINTQKVLRKKAKDAKSSREDILSINGRGVPKRNDPSSEEKADSRKMTEDKLQPLEEKTGKGKAPSPKPKA